jgi:hypothetical protein
MLSGRLESNQESKARKGARKKLRNVQPLLPGVQVNAWAP